MKSQTYEQDFLLWTEEQSALFRSGNIADLDLENIFVEIEDMGQGQKTVLRSLLRNILVCLLKLDLSPADPRPQLIEKIAEFRVQAQDRIEDSPSLKLANCVFEKAWLQAKVVTKQYFEFHGENILIPAECPYSLDQTLDYEYFP